MKLQFLGAARTVTGSKTLLTHHNQKYLIDCGLFQGPKEIRIQNWEVFQNAEELKAIFLTHAHLDHSGYIPKIVKEGFKGQIYCSQGTLDLCKILLRDAGRLQEEDAKFANRTGYSHHVPALPLYDELDAINSLALFTPMVRDEWHRIKDGLNMRLVRSGHIIGSSFVQLNCQTNTGFKIITFSGDLGNGRSPTLKPPVPILETDHLIIESTYGDRLQPLAQPADEMEKIINRVAQRGGVLVIPAFSVGRTQDILYLIRKLEDENRIPHLPVYLDSPMATEATNVYLKHPEDHALILNGNGFESPINTKNYHTVTSPDESMLLCMRDGPMIVVSAAGMLTGGRVMHHLAKRLPDAKNAVLFVGFQAEGTKGRLLQGGIGEIRIHHKTVDVEAEICTIESLSAHADQEDTIHWLKHLKRAPEMVYVNHGETGSAMALAARIREELKFNVCVPEKDQVFKLEE